MDIDDDAKELVLELGSAINSAVGNSGEVTEAIDRLRRAGYEMELTLRLEIGLRRRAGGQEDEEGDARGVEARLELTDEDRRTLRSMRIRFDEE